MNKQEELANAATAGTEPTENYPEFVKSVERCPNCGRRLDECNGNCIFDKPAPATKPKLCPRLGGGQDKEVGEALGVPAPDTADTPWYPQYRQVKPAPATADGGTGTPEQLRKWDEATREPAPATGEEARPRGTSGRFETREPKLRFNEKWIPEPNTGCWIWTSNVGKDGYGTFWFDNRFQSAHRMAWMLFQSEIPKGMQVCHKCDTPLCVNPEHLFLGTAKDNKQDSCNKGRSKKDPRNGRWTK